MAIRSVAELLPKPFPELGLDDVEEIVRRAGAERESLFFERKALVRSDLLAKSCSAFANTMGGLLVVGVPDESDELVGISDQVAEPQVWVKDLLRGNVIPQPPFRARRLDVGEERWLLLVLVEESSTTPHFTRRGAIYVRNPGSSDPVPVAEQRTLFELMERGRSAAEQAELRASQLASVQPASADLIQTLVLAPTGITGDAVRQLELLDPALSSLREVLDLGESVPVEEHWRQDSVALLGHVGTQYLASGAVLPARRPGVRVTKEGALLVHDAVAEGEWTPAAELDAMQAWLLQTLSRGRDLLLDLGAHGDLRVVHRIVGGKGTLMYAPSQGEPITRDIEVAAWARFDDDATADEALLNELAAELLRALGVSPRRRL